MDLQYGIAVTNKFSLFLDEDEDPYEVLRQKEEEAKSTKKEDKKSKNKSAKKAAAATEAKPKQAEQQIIKREDKPNQGRPERGAGGGRGGRGRELRENDGSRPSRRQGPRDNREGFKGDENVPPEFRDRGDGSNRRDRGEGGFERGRGGMRGRGGRGGGRGGRGGPRPDSVGRGGFGGFGDRRPNREFDRHSGNDRTGVKSVDKREGSGAHNWGSYRDDVEDQTQTQPTGEETTDWAAQQTTEQSESSDLNESGEAAPPKEEEEAKEMTLDEWKALEGQRRSKVTHNLRKAGEGVDAKQWDKGFVYTKKKSEGEEGEDSDEDDEEEDRHGHKKQLVTDIRITFADNPRRGGRGTGRGTGRGRGRGEGRGGPRGRGSFAPERGDRPPRGPRESAPRMDDETDFPRLVKSEA